MATHRNASAGEIDREAVWKDFRAAVNMSPGELEEWLETEDSRAVGWTREGESESVGHQSGRRIVAIGRKRKAELTDDDYRHMRKVVGFVRRHLAQGGPREERLDSRWRYSLMNWGHDPLKT
jgi:Protein of unknown function (DUF3140)